MARATAISVRAKAATIIAGITIVVTEMETEADLAREDHRAARDASVAKMKAVTAVQKVALEDRSHRDSVPVVPEEAEVQMLSLHQS